MVHTFLFCMHPEVKENIGFLILLCAGTISFSFKYSNLKLKFKKIIVTILKRRNQSAGNFIFLQTNLAKIENTSETLCNNSVIKKISVHVPTHLKPINDTAPPQAGVII